MLLNFNQIIVYVIFIETLILLISFHFNYYRVIL